MKKIIVFLFLVLVAVVTAVEVPFTQCIQVLDYQTGSSVSGLDCFFSDRVGNYSDVGMDSDYCVQITKGYSKGTYSFDVVCSDGGGLE